MKNAITLSIIAVVVIAELLWQWRRAQHYRANAMDLCAWNARLQVGDPSSPEATIRWDRIVSGADVCSFCGQKHDADWVSRNAWESQIEAMMVRDGIGK